MWLISMQYYCNCLPNVPSSLFKVVAYGRKQTALISSLVKAIILRLWVRQECLRVLPTWGERRQSRAWLWFTPLFNYQPILLEGNKEKALSLMLHFWVFLCSTETNCKLLQWCHCMERHKCWSNSASQVASLENMDGWHQDWTLHQPPHD